jgi:dipeptidyl aminopeptidase/acylaminoacyl peptidase
MLESERTSEGRRRTRRHSLPGRLLAALLFASACAAAPAPPRDPLAAAFVRRPFHTERIYTVAYSPDGRSIVSASWDGTAKIWDARTGRELRTLAGHGRGLYRAYFSPDGRRIATASRDWTVKIWDAASGRELRTLRGHTYAVKSVAWSPDGRRLVSASNDGALKIWDAETGRELRTLRHEPPKGEDVSVYSVVWSGDGKLIASGNGDRTVSLWDAQEGREVRALKGSEGFNVFSLAFSPDGRRLASAASGRKVVVWDVATGDVAASLAETPAQGADDIMQSVAWSPDGRLVAAGGARVYRGLSRYNGRVVVWDAETGRELRAADASAEGTSAVAFSPDGGTIATGSEDAVLKLWRAPSLEVLRVFGGHGAQKNSARFASFANAPLLLEGAGAGLRLTEIVGELDSGNVYLMRGVLLEYGDPSLFAKRSADARAVALARLYEETGGLDVRLVDRLTEREAAVLARARRGGSWWSLSLTLSDAGPHRIVALDFGKADAPGEALLRPSPPATGADGRTTFRLNGFRGAKRVALAGTFNGWSTSRTPLVREGNAWVVTLALAPGRYAYKFVVDEVWINDPGNPQREPDDAGNLNSLAVVKGS